jgi:hypothetical protein
VQEAGEVQKHDNDEGNTGKPQDDIAYHGLSPRLEGLMVMWVAAAALLAQLVDLGGDGFGKLRQ